MYSRISNPTVAAVEQKIAALEGGVGALCTTSGQAASLLAVLNICTAGDHFVAASTIYGGTVNLFAVTLKKFGIECTFVDAGRAGGGDRKRRSAPTQRRCSARPSPTLPSLCWTLKNSRAPPTETACRFIVDNTFATPVLCRPIEWGADIVVHSTTKYMDGHASPGGRRDRGFRQFQLGKRQIPASCATPDESYHGVTYTKAFRQGCLHHQGAGAADARFRHVPRRAGCVSAEPWAWRRWPCAWSATAATRNRPLPFLARQPRGGVCQLSRAVRAALSCRWRKKYLPDGCSGRDLVLHSSGGREAAVKFMDSLYLANNVVHVADICTCVLHPASSHPPPAHRRTACGRGHHAGAYPPVRGAGAHRRYSGRSEKRLRGHPLNGSRPVGMKRGAEHFLLCAAFCFARRQKVFRKLKQNVCACV